MAEFIITIYTKKRKPFVVEHFNTINNKNVDKFYMMSQGTHFFNSSLSIADLKREAYRFAESRLHTKKVKFRVVKA